MPEARDETSFVVARLTEEFDGRIDTGFIHRVATQEVALFEGAKVREFIPVIALRLARERLEESLRDTEEGEDRGTSIRDEMERRGELRGLRLR